MRKTLKYLMRTLLTLILIIAGYFIIALFFSYIGISAKKTDCKEEKIAFISTNGVHLNIIIPVENLDSSFLDNLLIPEGTECISFGWGDKDFYINTPEWSDLTFNRAFKALFFKTETAMHVTYYTRAYSWWEEIELCKFQLEILNTYIENTFKISDTNNFIKIEGAGYSYNDCFFEAHGSYSCFKTCNVWTNKALKEAGISTSVWSPFDFGVLYHLRKEE